MTGRRHLERACKKKTAYTSSVGSSTDVRPSSDSGVIVADSEGGELVRSEIDTSNTVSTECTEGTLQSSENRETVTRGMSDSDELGGGSEALGILDRERETSPVRRPGAGPLTEEREEARDDRPLYSPRQIERMLQTLIVNASRETASSSRRDRDRKVQGLPLYKDGLDIAKFIKKLELDLKDIGVPQGEFKHTLLQKLSPKAGEVVLTVIDRETCTYSELKRALCKELGSDKRDVAIKLFHSFNSDSKSLDLLEKFRKLQGLIDTLNLLTSSKGDLLLFIAEAVLRGSVGPQIQGLLDVREIKDMASLSQAAATLRQVSPSEYDRKPKREMGGIKCFRCHAFGHKSYECKVKSEVTSSGIVCFTCNQPGHKITTCPNKAETTKSKETAPVVNTQYNKSKNRKEAQADCRAALIEPCTDVCMGKVNGFPCKIVTDTGADISVVPNSLVLASQLLSESVNVRGSTGDRANMSLAMVPVEALGKAKVMKVAVAPVGAPADQMLLAVRLTSEERRRFVDAALSETDETDSGSDSLSLCGIPAETNVRAVTRSMQARENTEAALAAEDVDSEPLVPFVDDEVGPASMAADLYSSTGLGNDDGTSIEVFDSVEDSVVGSLGCPTLVDDSDVELLRSEVDKDESLSRLKLLAEAKARGYVFDKGLLFQDVLDDSGSFVRRLVLPTVRRPLVLSLAHDKAGHVGVRGMRALINRHFTWPGLHTDVECFVQSCDSCLRLNKSGNRTAKMVQRPIVSEPFDYIAVDIVGPLPKGKGGAKFILTSICMATRWPDALPMRNGSAKEVAECLIQLFARCSFPLVVLSDRGSVFLGKVNKRMMEILGIDTLHTSPYRPQGNGVLERFHGTLKPMLAKAVADGIDWVTFLPLALSVIRQIPSTSTGFSPSELVFGSPGRGPLDVLYAGWVSECFKPMDVSAWVESLQERLKILHDCAVANSLKNTSKRSESFNKHKSDQTLVVGDKVLLRLPGLQGSLQASWEGPFEVVKVLSKVNYKIRREGGRERIVHINNTKKYKEREVSVNSACLVAELMSEMWDGSTLLDKELCKGYNLRQLTKMLDSVSGVFSTKPGLCISGKCTIVVDPNCTVVNLPPRQIPIHIRDQVKAELKKLLADGIITVSDSQWASPIVPVKKPDNSIRVCIDYRELNKATPLRRYWLPSLSEILDRVGNAHVLSKLDLTSGFHQIQVDVESQDYTSFVCPFGKFKFLRMPFGLRNAPAIFQAVVESILKPVHDCCANYIDDVVIFSDSWSKHLVDVKRVFQCLGKAGLTVKKSKCEFGRRFMLYLGHKIGCGVLTVPEYRVSAMAEYGQPKTKKQLKAFLGSIGYYRQFVENFAECSSLLSPATSLSSPVRVQWAPEMVAAFMRLKVSLCTRVVLHVPSAKDVFILCTDASGCGVGACLHVVREGSELPVAFYSRQLQGAERNYSITELESLAIVAALNHFSFYLYGAEVTIFTDHKACEALLTSSVLNRRLTRFALKLQDWNLSIIYRPGRLNSNADGLSRQGWEIDELPLEPSCEVGQSCFPSDILGGGDVGPAPWKKKESEGQKRSRSPKALSLRKTEGQR